MSVTSAGGAGLGWPACPSPSSRALGAQVGAELRFCSSPPACSVSSRPCWAWELPMGKLGAVAARHKAGSGERAWGCGSPGSPGTPQARSVALTLTQQDWAARLLAGFNEDGLGVMMT